MDPTLPNQLLADEDDLSHLGVKAGLNASSHRFHRVLHLASSSGEQEKLAQVEQPGGESQGCELLSVLLSVPGCSAVLEPSSGGCLKSSDVTTASL